MKINALQIKKLRDVTGAPVIRVKQVLDEIMGDLSADATLQALQAGEKKALAILKEEGFEKAKKRAERSTRQGVIVSYVHHTRKLGVLVELLCETDFVARNPLFSKLAGDIALQIASMKPKDSQALLAQEFVRDPQKKVNDLLKEVIAKTGENIKVGRFERIEIGNE